MRQFFILFFSITFFSGLSSCDELKNNTDFHQEDTLNWVSTSRGSIFIKTYKSEDAGDSSNLVFVIHGDAPFNKPGYQYHMANQISEQNKNTISVGILRPGYTDPEENTSNGVRGFATGDNYSLEVIEAISEVIAKLKEAYRPKKTIIVGHSGGAAIAGALIGTKPGLASSAVLVSCPCNVLKWRRHMRAEQVTNPLWLLKVKSISPLDVVDNIPDDMEVIIIIGDQDDITPVNLSEEYYQKLKELSKRPKFILIPNEGHEILLNETVLNEISGLLN